MSPSLRTPRLKLHAFTADDVVELHTLFADPDTHTIGSGPFTALEQTERWIANRVTAQRDLGLCWYALRCTDTGLLIGNCGIFQGRISFEEPEIGYMIRASHRGCGYAIAPEPQTREHNHFRDRVDPGPDTVRRALLPRNPAGGGCLAIVCHRLPS